MKQHFRWATFRALEAHAEWLAERFSPSVVAFLMDRAVIEVIRQ